MEQVTISELKNRLSAYIKRVRAGQTIIVLDRDQPVAKIEALGVSAGPEDRLARLERKGIVRRAAEDLSLDALRPGAPRAKQSVVDALLDERREGR